MTEPTYAEILDAADDFRSQYMHGGITFDEFDSIGFARAVLAKWGTPAPVGVEPVVACGNCGGSGRMVRDPDIGTDQECFVCDGSGSFSEPATPQPTQPQAGAVPQGWKAVPVNPTPEMWKAAKTVPDPNPPYPPHYGLVWDAMLAAAPSIEQGGQHGTE